MQTVTLRFQNLSELTTFSRMVNEKFQLNTSTLTISGSFPSPFVSIAQSVFDAKLLQH
ncbi:MAG TPA: hypothetical protein VGN63_14610 [Flavisolibacter sp.]|jgi:hypothetical protein|nr:hypothetical protein [Flavisolibacter sp.]